MDNQNKMNGWAGKREYISRTSAQSYLLSSGSKISASGCGSSCGSKEGESNPQPSACGSGDSEPKPSACGASDSNPKPSACGAGDADGKPGTTACGSACGAGDK